MSRLVARALMALTGVTMLVVYVLVGLAVYDLARFLWALRPDPVTAVAVGLLTALVFGYLSYRLGTARILSVLDARELPPERAPRLYDRLDDVAASFDIDRPALLVADLGAPNALALGGPADGSVVVDATLFRLLSLDELEGVLAHEFAHLKGRDSLVKTLAYALVNTVAGTLFLVLFPVVLVAGGIARSLAYVRGRSPAGIERSTARARAAVLGLAVVLLFGLTLLLRAHSRRREYAADEAAATATERPLALARALDKIQRAATPGGPLSRFYIHGDEEGTLSRWFATHPPMDDRIERLRRLADEREWEERRPVSVPIR